MTAHQNRGKKIRMGNNPTPEMIKSLRIKNGMDASLFGSVGFYSASAVEGWESGDRRMHPLTWMAYKHLLREEEMVPFK